MTVRVQIRVGRGFGAGRVDGALNFDRVVPVDFSDHLPAVSLEARGRVVGEPALDFAVDRDAVVVPEGDQLAKAQRPASEQASWEMPSIMQPSPRNTQVW
jgi:hypothetical protein